MNSITGMIQSLAPNTRRSGHKRPSGQPYAPVWSFEIGLEELSSRQADALLSVSAPKMRHRAGLEKNLGQVLEGRLYIDFHQGVQDPAFSTNWPV